MPKQDNPQSPGELVRQLLDGKEWTQAELAAVLGVPPSRVTEIIQGKRAIDPELAVALSEAFVGTTPQEWLALESSYRLSLLPPSDESVRKRARLLDLAPVKDMERRGWIRQTANADELEQELLRFFGVSSLDAMPIIPVATRKATPQIELTPPQRAWCFRARQLAADQITPPFDNARLTECAGQLRKLLAFAPESRKVASTLNDFGIRFVIVEPLPGAKIDGAAFWIEDQPAIALSVRLDRIDSFWFTLFHEFSHIQNQDALSVDSDLVGEEATLSVMKSEIEQRADKGATELLIPQDKLESFIHRVAPLYSKERIIQFAHRIKVHPGIIVGQLQHRGQIGFHANREMLVKVRDIAVSTALVDGWGHTLN